MSKTNVATKRSKTQSNILKSPLRTQTDAPNRAAITTATDASASTSRWRRALDTMLTPAVIVGCMAGIAAIAYYFFMHLSLRLDESQSLWQSSHSLGGVLNVVARDVHVPLYHLILHFVITIFGGDVTTARLLSLGFFMATVPVIYLLSRHVLSRNWSLIVVLLFSFSPFLSWYGSEARMYTLLLFVTALNQLFYLRILKTGKGWFWYGLTAIIGAYSHYFFMFNLAAEALYYLYNRKQFKPGSFKKFIAVAVAVVLSLLPWLMYVYSLGSASGTRPQLPRPSTVDFFNVFSQIIFGFQSNTVNTLILSAWPVVMLIALVAVRRSRGLSSELKFIATVSILPVLLAYTISLVITPLFLSRYMATIVPPVLIMIVYLFSRYRQKYAAFVVALLFVTTIAGSAVQATSSGTPVKEDYRQAAMDINSSIQPQDVVVLSAPFTIYPFEYYYRGDAQIATLPNWNRSQAGSIPAFDRAKLPGQVAELNKNHRYIYLLLSQDQGYEDTIYQYYLTNFKQISRKTYSPGLTLYVYQVGYYTVPAVGSLESQEAL